MQNNKSSHILVLAANGMLGKAVYKYLHLLFPNSVWGTVKKLNNNKSFLLKLDAFHYEKDFPIIFKKLKKIDYVINCIGVLKDYKNIQELIFINALFPHKLEDLSIVYKFKLLHISTDAVFSPLSGLINEESIPSPNDYYGASKYLGETNSSNAITFRTSIIGFNPNSNNGLLEWILENKGKPINGYTNQKWSGSTTLQYATLCGSIISKKSFLRLRKKSRIFHFAPIEPITKYLLIKYFRTIIKDYASIKRVKGEIVNRALVTKYSDILSIRNYKRDIKSALTELLEFEGNIT